MTGRYLLTQEVPFQWLPRVQAAFFPTQYDILHPGGDFNLYK